MCLAVPGQITTIEPADDPLCRQGRVDFLGVGRMVSLAYVPDAQVGDYVVVHAGFALSVLDAQEAEASIVALRELAAGQPPP